MNKKGKVKPIVIVIGLAIAVLLFFTYFRAEGKTLKEIGQPADLSEEEEGKGMDITFYKKVDGEWVPVEMPDWFSAGARTGLFAVVEHPPAPDCGDRTECEGYLTNPDIACWEGSCVLANVDGMKVKVRVYNSETYAINDVYISDSVTETKPTGLLSALPVGIANKKPLPASGNIFWETPSVMDFEVLGWIGTTQTFSTKVFGTHPLTGATISSSSGDVALKFSADPVGTFSVIIESGIPGA